MSQEQTKMHEQETDDFLMGKYHEQNGTQDQMHFQVPIGRTVEAGRKVADYFRESNERAKEGMRQDIETTMGSSGKLVNVGDPITASLINWIDERIKTMELKAMEHPPQVDFASGGRSSKIPAMHLIPTVALVRVARRCELGIERKKEAAWNALSKNQQVLLDRDFAIERCGHAIDHATKLRDKLLAGGDPLVGDDDAAALMWSGMFACCATDAMSREAHSEDRLPAGYKLPPSQCCASIDDTDDAVKKVIESEKCFTEMYFENVLLRGPRTSKLSSCVRFLVIPAGQLPAAITERTHSANRRLFLIASHPEHGLMVHGVHGTQEATALIESPSDGVDFIVECVIPEGCPPDAVAQSQQKCVELAIQSIREICKHPRTIIMTEWK